MTEQFAGETTEQYIQRLEQELEYASVKADRLERESQRSERDLQRARADYDEQREDLDFLRDEIADLAVQFTSPSAPRTKQQMARLLNGWLRGESWTSGGWKR